MTLFSVIGMMLLASPTTASLLQIQQPTKEIELISRKVNVIDEKCNERKNSSEREQNTKPYESYNTQVQRNMVEYVNKHSMMCVGSEHNNIITPLFRRFTTAWETNCVEHYHFVCLEEQYDVSDDNKNDCTCKDSSHGNRNSCNYMLNNYDYFVRKTETDIEYEKTMNELYFCVDGVNCYDNSNDAWQYIHRKWEVMQKHCESIGRASRSSSEIDAIVHKTKEAKCDVKILPFPKVLLILVPQKTKEYTFTDMLQSKVFLPKVIYEETKRETAVCEAKHRVIGFPFLLDSSMLGNLYEAITKENYMEIFDSKVYDLINGQNECKCKVDETNNLNAITLLTKWHARTCNECTNVLVSSTEFLSCSMYFNKWCVPTDFVYHITDVTADGLRESNINNNNMHWCYDLESLLLYYSNNAKSQECKTERNELNLFTEKDDSICVNIEQHVNKETGCKKDAIDNVFVSDDHDGDGDGDYSTIYTMLKYALRQHDKLISLQRSFYLSTFFQVWSSLFVELLPSTSPSTLPLITQNEKCHETWLNGTSLKSCLLEKKLLTDALYFYVSNLLRTKYEVKSIEACETFMQKGKESQTEENSVVVNEFTEESILHYLVPPRVKLHELIYNERCCDHSQVQYTSKIHDDEKTEANYELADMAEQIFINVKMKNKCHKYFVKEGDIEAIMPKCYNEEWNLPKHSLTDTLEKAVVELPEDDLTIMTKIISPSLQQKFNSSSGKQTEEEYISISSKQNNRTDRHNCMQPQTFQSEYITNQTLSLQEEKYCEEEEQKEMENLNEQEYWWEEQLEKEELEMCIDALLLFLQQNVTKVQLFLEMCKQLQRCTEISSEVELSSTSTSHYYYKSESNTDFNNMLLYKLIDKFWMYVSEQLQKEVRELQNTKITPSFVQQLFLHFISKEYSPYKECVAEAITSNKEKTNNNAEAKPANSTALLWQEQLTFLLAYYKVDEVNIESKHVSKCHIEHEYQEQKHNVICIRSSNEMLYDEKLHIFRAVCAFLQNYDEVIVAAYTAYLLRLQSNVKHFITYI